MTHKSFYNFSSTHCPYNGSSKSLKISSLIDFNDNFTSKTAITDNKTFNYEKYVCSCQQLELKQFDDEIDDIYKSLEMS